MAKKVLRLGCLWLSVIGLLLISTWFLLNTIGDLMTYFHQGADPASALNIVPNVPPDLHIDFRWQSDDADSGRPMELFTRSQIQAAYMRAWLQWNISLAKGTPYGLETYFVGPALNGINTDIEQETSKGYQITQVDTTHTIQLHFYSADGSIVSFTDNKALVARVIRDRTGSIVFVGESEETYQVVMLLEDGNWRIRYWVKANESAPTYAPPTPTGSGFVGVDGTRLTLNGQTYTIAGVNYYEKDTPWDKFWLDYNGYFSDIDFALLNRLRINAVRIFVPFYEFGGAEVGNEPTPQPGSNIRIIGKPLEKLADILKAAKKHHLHVIVTLFDFYSDYSLLQWPQTDQYLKTILTHFRNDPTILAWDLKNEPDLDYNAAGKAIVDSWLAHIALLARMYDPDHLLTIGWSNYRAAQTLIAGIDFVSFHFYQPAAVLPQAYAALRKAIPHLPIVLTEFGMSIGNGITAVDGHTEVEQADYYAAILKFWRTTQSPGALCWTLYDFTYVPANLFGNLPWRIEAQKHFGIVRTDGSLKPAALLMAPGAGLQAPELSIWDTWLKPLHIFVALLLALFIVLIIPRTRSYVLRRSATWWHLLRQVHRLSRRL